MQCCCTTRTKSVRYVFGDVAERCSLSHEDSYPDGVRLTGLRLGSGLHFLQACKVRTGDANERAEDW